MQILFGKKLNKKKIGKEIIEINLINEHTYA